MKELIRVPTVLKMANKEQVSAGKYAVGFHFHAENRKMTICSAMKDSFLF